MRFSKRSVNFECGRNGGGDGQIAFVDCFFSHRQPGEGDGFCRLFFFSVSGLVTAVRVPSDSLMSLAAACALQARKLTLSSLKKIWICPAKIRFILSSRRSIIYLVLHYSSGRNAAYLWDLPSSSLSWLITIAVQRQ